jgi:hypothetical protein
MWFNSLLGVKIIHLADRTDLSKMSLVYGGKETVTSLCSSLDGLETERETLGSVQ